MTQRRNKRLLGRRTLQEIEREGRSQTESRLSFFTSGLGYQLYRFLPFWMLRLIPFIQDDILDLWRQEQEAIEEIQPLPPSETQAQPWIESQRDFTYPAYRCIWGDPLSCHHPRQSIETDPDTKSCLKCGFPVILRPKAEIIGHRGRYRITQFLGSRGMGRLYQGIQGINGVPVIIKEYLLPKRYFNSQEEKNYKDNFENIAGAVLADGRLQDFRILGSWDAIGDRHEERCYFVTQSMTNSYPTLRTYLQQKGAMNQYQVLHFLNQVLQSLESLHGQKYRLPSNQIQDGLAHGNLTLDSLLILPQEQQFFPFPQFLIYLCDLSLWEHRFYPPTITVKRPTLDRDLRQVGQISLALLTGAWTTESEQNLQQKSQQNWPEIDPKLQEFLSRLLEIETPFVSAAEARQSLPQLSKSFQPLESEFTQIAAVKKRGKPWWILGLLLLALAGGLTGWWLRRSRVIATTPNPVVCCVQNIPAIPQGQFSYTGVKNSIGDYVITQPNLVGLGTTLATELQKWMPKFELTYQPVSSAAVAIAQVREEKADFALTSAIYAIDLETEIIAYDGLVIFVPFSYEFRQKSLPRLLKGELSLEQVRRLYTGEITNWKTLGGPDLPVKLYVPQDEELIRIFEERVLQDPEAIAAFRQQFPQPANSDTFITSEPPSSLVILPIFELLRTMLSEFENQDIGGIGFGAIVQVFGQCSVYPLSISTPSQPAVQPLIQKNNQPVNPGTDLCNDKGNYYPHAEWFQTGKYPLAYTLAVIYPRDNSRPPAGQKFAELLKTEELQKILAKTGLIPLNSLP